MTMDVQRDLSASAPKRTPWNKGKLLGAKPPLWPKHVWSIRTKLQIEGRTLDLALFNLAIDSKLRGCDVVALRVEDVAPNGYAIARAGRALRPCPTYIRACESSPLLGHCGDRFMANLDRFGRE
jgi:hypothetical protein